MESNRALTINTGNTYEFDMDQNGFPAFTKKNVEFVTAIIGYDSNYSTASDENNYESIFAEPNFWSLARLDMAVESIDRINSTHLASEGSAVKGGHGREITTEFIRDIGGVLLKQRLLSADPALVTDIASAVKTKFNFSFATKFCAYASRYALKVDNYCIYDKVVQTVLPYYYYIYVDGDGYREFYRTKKTKVNESTIDTRFRGRHIQNGYAQYRKCVDDIIAGIDQKCGIHVTYEQFDHVLWYCFKGSNTRVQKALNCLPLK